MAFGVDPIQVIKDLSSIAENQKAELGSVAKTIIVEKIKELSPHFLQIQVRNNRDSDSPKKIKGLVLVKEKEGSCFKFCILALNKPFEIFGAYKYGYKRYPIIDESYGEITNSEYLDYGVEIMEKLLEFEAGLK